MSGEEVSVPWEGGAQAGSVDDEGDRGARDLRPIGPPCRRSPSPARMHLHSLIKPVSGSGGTLPFRRPLRTGRLVTPVRDHWNAERAELSIGLGNVHAPDRQRIPGHSGPVHVHRRLRPGLRGQSDLAVDPGRPAHGIALSDLADADQRVRPAPQHHLLQGPDRGPVLFPRRLEDPAPQPHYVQRSCVRQSAEELHPKPKQGSRSWTRITVADR